jgi:hypothetical protein
VEGDAVNLDLTVDEMRLAQLALKRLRAEINVDGDSKIAVINPGQAQACRFTLPFVDELMAKLVEKANEALNGRPLNDH